MDCTRLCGNLTTMLYDGKKWFKTIIVINLPGAEPQGKGKCLCTWTKIRGGYVSLHSRD